MNSSAVALKMDSIIDKYKRNFNLLRMMYLDVDYDLTFHTDSSGPVRDISFDTVEQRYLLSAYQDGSIVLFDMDSGKQLNTSGSAYTQLHRAVKCNIKRDTQSSASLSPVTCIQWYPVDTGTFYTSSVDNSIMLWDTNRFECADLIKVPDFPSWIALSEYAFNHNLVAVALDRGENGRALLLDPLIGAPVMNLLGGHSAAGLSIIDWSRRSSYFVVTGGHDGKILFWDIRTPVKPFCSLDRYNSSNTQPYSPEATAHAGSILSMSFTPDGMHLLSWGGTGSNEEAMCLRMWSGGPDDTAASHSFRPTLRPVNFGTIYSHPGSMQTSRVSTIPGVNRAGQAISHRVKRTAVRMAVASGTPGDAWGAESVFIYVPARNRVLMATAGRKHANTQEIARHHDDVRACVWNSKNQELYTCGKDGNMFVWPIHRQLTGDCSDSLPA